MEGFHRLGRLAGVGAAQECRAQPCLPRATGTDAAPLGQQVGHADRAQVRDQAVERRIADRGPLDIDHRHREAGTGEQTGQRRGIDPRVRAGSDNRAIGGQQRAAQERETVAADEGAEHRRIGLERSGQAAERERQVVDSVQRAAGDDRVEPVAGIGDTVFVLAGSRLDHGHAGAAGGQPDGPGGIERANQQDVAPGAVDPGEAVEQIVERRLQQERIGEAQAALAGEAARLAVEEVGGHGAACAAAGAARQGGVTSIALHAGRIGRALLDFALPPRCAACRTIVDEVDIFCVACWSEVAFLSGGCVTCGLPLAATDADQCAVCLAAPPRIDRIRAAVAYGPIARQLALRLKYGRKVAVARTMARYMAGLAGGWAERPLIVPVPLHRRRLWWRGFNQAALIAAQLAKRWPADLDQHAIVRTKSTQSLKGLGHDQRRRALRGAFAVSDKAAIQGRTVVLIDDVLASGATSEACARVLRRAGAARVELVCWARVVRPARLMR